MITRKQYLEAQKIVDRYTKQLNKPIVLSSKHGFGEQKDYQKGDVVVWRGDDPCIGRIFDKTPIDRNHLDEDCFVISKTHNSLHYSNLRYATQKEKQKLGRKRLVLIA